MVERTVKILKFIVTSLMLFASLATPLGAAQAISSQQAAVPLDALAKALLLRAGVSNGIVSMPRCGDGLLTLAVARNGGLLVHAMDADRKNIDALAARAADGELLGRSLYVGEGAASIIPFADDYVNLLIISDATDDNQAAANLPEIVRTLVPGTGKAVIGLAKGASGTLSRSKLETWLKGCNGATTTVVEDQHGLWGWVTKGPKPGGVAWTHRLFSPANNPVTPDTAAAWPLMTRWLGKPYLGRNRWS